MVQNLRSRRSGTSAPESVPLLAAPGTNLPTSLTILLSVTVNPQATGPVITNTATVSRFGIDPNTANNSSSVSVATSPTCVQDDGPGGVLSINLGTGEYQFSNCQGVTVAGTGVAKVKGCLITLQHVVADRRVQAQIDTCQKKGTATVQVLSIGRTFTLTDRNTGNNSCACAGG
jgi:hypothetical protein